ncbi:MAG: ABC transporter ATP-binding protein [Pseudomonadota bacterium]
MLKIEEITVRYGATTGINKISMEVHEGEIVTLIGANGAGKSTTLRAINGLEPLAHGSIRMNGHLVSGASPAAVLDHGISHCPEGRRVFPQLTVRENMEMGAYRRRDKVRVRDDMERMFDKFPRLRERIQQVAGTLSGGEQQMLAIARSLMSRPKLVMFDEPSLGLAPNIVEQNAYAALAMCDRGYLLENGHIVTQGTSAEMRANPEIRRAYLGG